MNTSFATTVDQSLSLTSNRELFIGFGMALAAAVGIAILIPHVHVLRFVEYAAVMAFLAVGCACLASTRTNSFPASRDRLQVLGIGTLVLAVVTWTISPAQASKHPIFKTPLTGNVGARPAIQVDVVDDSEMFGTAELYLTVQSSRFSEDVRLIFPVNRGDFIGCRSRFIQLPFEVVDGDVILFNMLDEDDLSPAEEKNLLDACRAGGYCLEIAGYFVAPSLTLLARPAFCSASEIVGEGIVIHYRENTFKNVGVGEYIVQSSRPRAPNEANRVTLVQQPSRARAHVRVYFPVRELH